MNTWIVFFRGINVGGNNILPMAELKNSLKSLNLNNIRSYIQSGNIIFESDIKSKGSLIDLITQHIDKHHGFRPHLVLLNQQDLITAIKSNPFPDAISDPKTLHFYFLASSPLKPNLKALNEIKKPSETFKLFVNVFYLHAPEGIGRSKLAAQVEKHLGVVITARNYRTVNKVYSLLTQE